MRGLLFNAGYLESMLHLSYKVTKSYARQCRNYKFFMNLKLHKDLIVRDLNVAAKTVAEALVFESSNQGLTAV